MGDNWTLVAVTGCICLLTAATLFTHPVQAASGGAAALYGELLPFSPSLPAYTSGEKPKSLTIGQGAPYPSRFFAADYPHISLAEMSLPKRWPPEVRTAFHRVPTQGMTAFYSPSLHMLDVSRHGIAYSLSSDLLSQSQLIRVAKSLGLPVQSPPTYVHVELQGWQQIHHWTGSWFVIPAFIPPGYRITKPAADIQVQSHHLLVQETFVTIEKTWKQNGRQHTASMFFQEQPASPAQAIRLRQSLTPLQMIRMRGHNIGIREDHGTVLLAWYDVKRNRWCYLSSSVPVAKPMISQWERLAASMM